MLKAGYLTGTTIILSALAALYIGSTGCNDPFYVCIGPHHYFMIMLVPSFLYSLITLYIFSKLKKENKEIQGLLVGLVILGVFLGLVVTFTGDIGESEISQREKLRCYNSIESICSDNSEINMNEIPEKCDGINLKKTRLKEQIKNQTLKCS